MRAGMPLEDRWILHRMNAVSAEISEALDKFRFHEASALIYQFIWHELCDWYIELVKPVLTNPSVPEEERGSRIRVLVHVMDYALRMLHPFMPFITEEIWQKMPHEGESIMMQEFPAAAESAGEPSSGTEDAGPDGTDRGDAGFARRNEYRSQAHAGCGAVDQVGGRSKPWFRRIWRRYRRWRV